MMKMYEEEGSIHCRSRPSSSTSNYVTAYEEEGKVTNVLDLLLRRENF